MFELESQQSWVDAQPGEVIYLATSINRPAVAPPKQSPESSQAYICSIRKREGFYVYIYLHLMSSNTGLLYRWSEGAVKSDQVATLQHNALEFTESMGFMMDDLRFSELPPEQKGEVFSQAPVFHQDISFLKPPDESVSELEVVEPEETEGSADELDIETVEETENVPPEEAGGAASESGVEEITLDVMTADEVAPAVAEAEPDPAPALPSEDDVALDAISAEVSEEDILLDRLEAGGEALPAEAADDSVSIEMESEGEESSALLDALEAQEAEAPPLPSTQGAEPEEEEVEITVEGEETEAPAPPPQPATRPVAAPLPKVVRVPAAAPLPRPAPVPRAYPPPRPTPTPAAAPQSADTGPEDGGVSPEEWNFLVRLLAMM